MININAMMEYQWHYDLTLLGLLSRFFVISRMENDLENAHHVVQFLVHLGSADPKKNFKLAIQNWIPSGNLT